MLSIIQPLITMLGGAAVKMLSWKLQQSHTDRSIRDMIVLQGFNADAVTKLQGGTDTADKGTRATRRFLAILFASTFCFIVTWLIIHPHTIPNIELVVPQRIPLLWKFFGLIPKTDQTVIEISFLTLFSMSFKVIMEFLAGFYFTKMGK